MALVLSDGRTLEGIHRITLPLPFEPMTVCCYLLSAERTTLIDCGLGGPGKLDELRQALKPTGIRVEEIELLVVTHAHLDHCGLAGSIKAASGCQVAAQRLDADLIEHFPQGDPSHNPRIAAMLASWGVPEDLIRAREEQTLLWRYARDEVQVDLKLEDWDLLDLGDMRLRSIHVPGHCQGQMVLHDPNRNLLFSADHLLPDISPVPLIQFFHGGSELPKSLVNFLSSVRKVDALGLELALPAHGNPILEVDTLIEGYRLHIEKRQLMVERILRKSGPMPAFDAAGKLFGDKKANEQMVLCLSEIVGHLQLLDRRGRLNIERRDDLYYYGYKEDY